VTPANSLPKQFLRRPQGYHAESWPLLWSTTCLPLGVEICQLSSSVLYFVANL